MEIKDLVIIGGGPAGCSAAVYSARKLLNTTIITNMFEGQSIVSPEIYNWIGTKAISGRDLSKNLEMHVKSYEEGKISIIESKAISITKEGKVFSISVKNGEIVKAYNILITTGSERRKLNIKGADEYEHKGLTYCATCDGPLFTDKDVLVVGGGNAGFETAAQLLAYCKSVTLLHRGDAYKADEITIKKVLENPKMTGILNAKIEEITGDILVNGAVYTNSEGALKKLDIEGVFVEIGQIPTTNLVEDLVDLDEYKRIKIDPWTQKTSNPNIWAAGDCTNALYHQNNIVAGDAIKALENIYISIKTK